MLDTHDAVHPVIVGLSKLGVESQVCHGVVGVSQEVGRDVLGAIVKILFAVAFVSLKFVGIYEVVKEGDDTILKVGDFFLRWFNVEGELFESLDAHELVVESEHGIEQWSLLEISYGLLPIKHFFNIN